MWDSSAEPEPVWGTDAVCTKSSWYVEGPGGLGCPALVPCAPDSGRAASAVWNVSGELEGPSAALISCRNVVDAGHLTLELTDALAVAVRPHQRRGPLTGVYGATSCSGWGALITGLCLCRAIISLAVALAPPRGTDVIPAPISAPRIRPGGKWASVTLVEGAPRCLPSPDSPDGAH